MKILMTIILLLACRFCNGQNLIPNGDFEQYSACPMYLTQIDSALYWMNPMTNIQDVSGSPDYFHKCSESSQVDVPNNNWGSQEARSGDGYSGILLYLHFTSNVREYIETPLMVPLELNNCYHFEMFVNLGDYCQYASHDIQVYFSDSVITGVNNFHPLPFVPQIYNDSGTIFNNQSWTLVAGDYTSHGGENYLLIGNFKNDSLTNLINQGPNIQKSAYVYIDDVSLTQIPCTVGVTDENSDANFIVYPNPFSNHLLVELSNNEHTTIILYDYLLRRILKQIFTNSTTIITDQLANGIYFYELSNSIGTVKSGKIIKQ